MLPLRPAHIPLRRIIRIHRGDKATPSPPAPPPTAAAPSTCPQNANPINIPPSSTSARTHRSSGFWQRHNRLPRRHHFPCKAARTSTDPIDRAPGSPCNPACTFAFSAAAPIACAPGAPLSPAPPPSALRSAPGSNAPSAPAACAEITAFSSAPAPARFWALHARRPRLIIRLDRFRAVLVRLLLPIVGQPRVLEVRLRALRHLRLRRRQVRLAPGQSGSSSATP